MPTEFIRLVNHFSAMPSLDLTDRTLYKQPSNGAICGNSAQRIASGDCYTEHTVKIAGVQTTIGLTGTRGTAQSEAGYIKNIGARTTGANALQIIDSAAATLVTTVSGVTIAVNDVIRVSIESNVHKVYVNGVLKWTDTTPRYTTSQVAALYPLIAAFYFSANSNLWNPQLSGANLTTETVFDSTKNINVARQPVFAAGGSSYPVLPGSGVGGQGKQAQY